MYEAFNITIQQDRLIVNFCQKPAWGLIKIYYINHMNEIVGKIAGFHAKIKIFFAADWTRISGYTKIPVRGYKISLNPVKNSEIGTISILFSHILLSPP